MSDTVDTTTGDGPALSTLTRDELNDRAAELGIANPGDLDTKEDVIGRIVVAQSDPATTPDAAPARAAAGAGENPTAHELQNDGRPPLADLAVERAAREDASARVIDTTTDDQED